MSDAEPSAAAGASAPAAASPLATTLEVKLGQDTYVFKIPTLHDEIAIGSRMSTLRRAIDPSWDGFTLLDGTTQYALRAAATFELLLQRASVTWPFSEGLDKKPVIDSSKFPADKAHVTVQAYERYEAALNRFRYGGAED